VGRELRGISARKAVGAFKKSGFKELRQRGSHVLLQKEGHPLLVINVHARSLKVGLLKAAIKKAGLTREEFEALL
jgi:predicted RNA binding protein YcfA (HicA-like mRNA interferase family)